MESAQNNIWQLALGQCYYDCSLSTYCVPDTVLGIHPGYSSEQAATATALVKLPEEKILNRPEEHARCSESQDPRPEGGPDPCMITGSGLTEKSAKLRQGSSTERSLSRKQILQARAEEGPQAGLLLG